ncbi:hypothetical protein PR002_g10988 [Phytophthora rubi]|uniref:Uncharacterized protein n=1 Tax=Phytophthora rubi TaxID=129364 RepID=A0A6A3M8Y7_9STRA|nr:hypothetical protein PR002_g10988 [Phytophthora rubi]
MRVAHFGPSQLVAVQQELVHFRSSRSCLADDPSSTLPMPHQGCRAHAGGHGAHCGDRLQQPDDLALQAIDLVPAGWEGRATYIANVLSSVCLDGYYVFVSI